MANNSTRILGPPLAGALIRLVGIQFCYYAQSASCLCALYTSLLLRAPSNADESSGETVWENLRYGATYIRGQKSVLAILVVSAVTSFFAMPYAAMLPVLARHVYKVDASGLGLMMAISAAGAFLGSLVLAMWVNPSRRGLLVLISALVFSLGTVALSLADSFLVASVAMAIVGVGSALNFALSITLLQLLVPDALRGRVIAAYNMSFGLMPLGSLMVGAIAELGGAPLAIGLAGAASAACVLVTSLLVPELRALD